MAEGGQPKGAFSHSLVTEPEDGKLGHSGSQNAYEFFCEPCDGDHGHIEATFYCRNCTEYMCTQCSKSHKRFKRLQDHNIHDVRLMRNKPPVSTLRPASTKAFTTASHVKELNIWDGGVIRSLVLMSTNMLLVVTRDPNAWFLSWPRVILVDTGSGRQVSEFGLEMFVDWPLQVTRISNTEAAVPGRKKIVLLRIQPKISVIRNIDVQGECHGIAYKDSKLIVTYLKQVHVDILDMFGKVIRTISADQSGKSIFTGPKDVTINPATGSVYVIDRVKDGTNRLVKLGIEGSVLATYDYGKGDSIFGVALDSQGIVYVGCKITRFFGLVDSYGVQQLSADLDKVRTIIVDLPSRPAALSFDEATQQLYVGLQDKNVARVYRLS